jgi:transcriptional regulator with XRE-family HTH domain
LVSFGLRVGFERLANVYGCDAWKRNIFFGKVRNYFVFLTKFDKSYFVKHNMSSEISIGKFFRELRNERKETLHQVAVGTYIDSPLLSKIERGERLPTSEQLKKLSVYYDVPEEELRVKHTAEKILKEYGANETTYDAIQLVNEQLTNYAKNNKQK